MASAPTFGTGNKQAGQACNTDGTNHAKALSVYVSGGDVYVAGYEQNSSGIGVAKVWKNGAATTLGGGTEEATAQSVYVSGSDVYVAGHIGEAGILWKNGAATALDDDGWLFSVFVK